MDTASRLDRVHDHGHGTSDHDGIDDRPFAPGDDERRMHVRAYNHWVSLLKGRPCPTIDDLDPGSIADFGPNSMLLDFSGGIDDPGIAFIGQALHAECELAGEIARIGDVPPRSLLSRLTDHYLQIIANRAPIGFEAEFVGARGRTMLYRGILMPFSSDGEAIDYIYGVINWKEMVDAATQATLAAELDAAVRAAPAGKEAAVWADGPSAGAEPIVAIDAGEALLSGSLAKRLTLARESAAQVRASDARSRAALYRALARAHDFAIAAAADNTGYRALLDDAGLTGQARAPMTPIAKLIFGADHDKTRLTEYAAVLSHARRRAVPSGGLAPFLDQEGGIKALVAAERVERRPASPPNREDRVLSELRARAPLMTTALAAGEREFVVLLARANSGGTLDVIARVEQRRVVDGVVRRAA